MKGTTRILVIEDEPAIADTLVYALRTEGFLPEWRATGRDGLAAFAEAASGEIASDGVAASAGFALVILDVGLPDVNGFDLCRELRARTTVPVLFLTARSSEIDRVVGLELGGDDYVTKPFSPREVTARVRAILRRTSAGAAGGSPEFRTSATALTAVAPGIPAEGSPARMIEKPIPVLEIDDAGKIARFRGVKLDLARYEFRLLAVLHSRPGRVWSRDELMMQAWEDPGASLDRTVDAHIKTLRSKLRAIAPAADPIQTHRGEGYSLRLPA